MTLLEQLSAEWKALETRVRLGLSRLEHVSEFIRTWTLKAGASADPQEREMMLSMLRSASQTLTAQAQEYEAMIARGLQSRALEQERRLQEDAARARTEALRAERAEYDRRQREQAQRDAAAKLEKTREETRAIQRETERLQQEARDRQSLTNRMLTNPELYCRHCNRAFADTTGGCPYCTARVWPRW